MAISATIQQAMNSQINAELQSSYLYLSMAAYFESANFKGFASWLKIQSQEEYAHAIKLYGFLIERGGKVVLSDIEAPNVLWKSPLSAFEEVYSHEIKVTALINSLMSLSKKEADYATETFLQWFVNEQVEEESSSLAILEKLRLIKDSVNGLFMLDHQLGGRK